MVRSVLLLTSWIILSSSYSAASDGLEFFEKKIRPILVDHCYQCHSAKSQTLEGGLRLDVMSGWQTGGDSGAPAIVPGKPDASPLMLAMRHAENATAMPPKQNKLPESVLADFAAWITMGAPDPRDRSLEPVDSAKAWESEYLKRLDWWSLKAIAQVENPIVVRESWPRNEVDRFILSQLEKNQLQPAAEAQRQTLARRLSFALTGLPPSPEVSQQFANDESPLAYEELVDQLLKSPQFGERWARHWMDVVHYADTHGYEWDVPAKNAWRYRDYLIRAFQNDLPYQRLILEQIAGDLLEPRIDAVSGVNEALIGPMMLRLGERRHGDNSAAEGVAQEGVANAIDTLGKAFLGTTLACAQCHDHKLDAVEQRDYYSLAGMLMSTRYSSRTIDSVDPNLSTIDQMRRIKSELRKELSRLWLAATDVTLLQGAAEKLNALAVDKTPAATFPASLAEFWKRSQTTPLTKEEFTAERDRRIAANQANLTLIADFRTDADANGWQWDGFGMKHGLVVDGELVVNAEGDSVLQHLLPAGRYSHVWSQRLAGCLQSPRLETKVATTFSMELTSGKHASSSFIVDRALNPERLAFPASPLPNWQTFVAGNFDTLEGSIDRLPRRVYYELATKSLNNYFPPRVGYGGVSEAEVADVRSWFGVSRIYQHPAGKPPEDQLDRFQPLFDELSVEPDWSRRLTLLLRAAVQRWSVGECTSEDVRLLNDGLQLKLLTNEPNASVELTELLTRYRQLEQQLQLDKTVGSAAEWDEGEDASIGIRGSYTDLGDKVERGQVRFLQQTSSDGGISSSRRLEWAHGVASADNPLTARVYVNRVWHYLFGTGLVRTPDDFGHLGEAPSHPELLDYLAQRFVREGWSTKKLIRLLVTSATWRQQSTPNDEAIEKDPENRLWHHLPMRRLEAEAIRDNLLAVSGRLEGTLYGPPIEPYRTAEDSQKRLFKGPLAGDGRRSVYLEMTLMEMPRFLALFNQPIPKQTVGRRDVTNVPDQALALLNDPFVIDMAKCWSQALLTDGAPSAEVRAGRMLEAALSRAAKSHEVESLVRFLRRSAELRGSSQDLMNDWAAWQDAAHAVFNLKEFIYVP